MHLIRIPSKSTASGTRDCSDGTQTSAQPRAQVWGGPYRSRRTFLQAAAFIPSLLAGRAAHADVPGVSAPDFWNRPRWAWVRRVSTGEQVREVYWADGALIEPGYDRLSWALRDIHMERRLATLQRQRAEGRAVVIPADWYCAVAMSPVVLDISYAYCSWLACFGIQRPLDLTDGGAFRHPATVAAFRDPHSALYTEGAAKDSKHMHGGAIDPSIVGVQAEATARFGLWLQAGGVGFYPSKHFTHVDDGRIRFWHG
jgi:uncharacterized protein YcbK (DUF882 family)